MSAPSNNASGRATPLVPRAGQGDNHGMHTFTLEYWQDEGWYVGRLKEVARVASQGPTLAELEDNIRDAYQLMTDTEPAPTAGPVLTRDIEV
jgi:predicted RNase H-like HicB family nuclease